MTKSNVGAWFLIVVAFLAGTARAGITTYSDAASFQAASAGLTMTTIDFEGIVSAPNKSVVYKASEILSFSGVTFTTPRNLDLLIVGEAYYRDHSLDPSAYNLARRLPADGRERACGLGYCPAERRYSRWIPLELLRRRYERGDRYALHGGLLHRQRPLPYPGLRRVYVSDRLFLDQSHDHGRAPPVRPLHRFLHVRERSLRFQSLVRCL